MNKNYLTFSTEEIALDQAFIDYVLSDKNAGLWTQWLHQNPDQETKVEEAKNLVLSLHNLNGKVEDKQLDRVWNNIEAATKPQLTVVETSTQSPRLWIKWVAAAAAAIIVGVFLFNVLAGNEVHHTNFAESMVVYLPDSSKVTLAPASNLEVVDYDNQRTLNLEGEAFFEVKKGSTFTVNTTQGNVTVLGTSFNVSSFPKLQLFEVGCATGKVRVTSGQKETILTPGMQTRKENQNLITSNVDELNAIGSWQKGFYVVKNCNIEQLSYTLERHYNRKFVLGEDVTNKYVTGKFPLNDLKVLTERLSFILNTKVDTTSTNVQIGE